MVLAYHDGTKHRFHAFARSLGYLDWASQPDPFRSFEGAREIPLYPRPDALQSSGGPPHCALTLIGDVLRHSLGLSAWKQFRSSRWSLRVNPSSGNLHPTEAYVIAGPAAGLGDQAVVCHYAADRHVLEQRCAFDAAAWPAASRDGVVWLVALTSIHWREAWKYGERAFRYCQHDLGHAMAATSIAAALAGCRVALVPEWSHRDIAAITGTDRDEDYVDAEREEPGCLLVVGREPLDWPYFVQAFARDRSGLIDAVRRGVWTGRASQLSEDHVQWTFIDDIAQATEDRGRRVATRPHASNPVPPNPINPIDPINPVSRSPDHSITRVVDRRLVLRRRSALALDGRYGVDADRFFTILERTLPGEAPPWDALWWDPRIHLALFVHRVDAVSPGLYMLVRQTGALDRLKAAMTRDFLWQRVSDRVPLFLLARGDCRQLSERVSCDQEIAADGFFSLGMIAEFDASLREFGPSFYRHLFWESGVVGQVLYLAGEAAGARGTGIGCFYDDPVHDVLGLTGHAFQSLYHFTIGVPIEDTRLTTESGYEWG